MQSFRVGENVIYLEKLASTYLGNAPLTQREIIARRYWSSAEEMERKEQQYQAGLVVKEPELKKTETVKKRGTRAYLTLLWPFQIGPIGWFFVFTFVASICTAIFVWTIIAGAIWIAPFLLDKFLDSEKRYEKKNREIQKENEKMVKAYQEQLRKNEELIMKSLARIEQAKARAIEQAEAAIEDYDKQVEDFAKKALDKADVIEDMVAHTVMMFERMISHQAAGNDVKFVTATLTYEVTNTGINYIYQSGYFNTESGFDFGKNRFHVLNNYKECEGLGKALALLVTVRMKEKYSSPMTSVSSSHTDAKFTLSFNSANENFEAARDIF